MRRFLILASLLFLTLAGNSVLVVTTSSVTTNDYFKSVKVFFNLRKNGDYIISSVSQTLPTSDAPNFKAVSYSINSEGSLVPSPPLSLSMNETAISLDIAFEISQLTADYGCVELQDDENYFSTVCKLQINYAALDDSRIYAEIKYTIGVKVERMIQGEFELGVNPVLIDGCDCSLVVDVKAKTELFTDEDCRVPLKAGEKVKYGSTLCLKLYSDDAVVQDKTFHTTTLNMYYTSSLGQLKELDVKSISKFGCGSPCQPATAYAILSLPVVGQVQFQQVVVMKEMSRLLTNTGLDDDDDEGTTDKTTQGISIRHSSVEVENRDNALRTGSFFLLILLTAALVIL